MDMNGCVVCDAEIEKSYHWLAEHYPNLCHQHKDEVHGRRSDKFIEHLNRASKIVQSWPQWKREIFRNEDEQQ